MSSRNDLAYKGLHEVPSAGASYTSHKVVLADANNNPVTDTIANFVSKSGIVPILEGVLTIQDNINNTEALAGGVVVAGVEGKRILPIDFFAEINGAINATTATVVMRGDLTTTSVMQTIHAAGMTDGAFFRDGDTTNITAGAFMRAPLADGEGVLLKASSTIGTANSIDVGLIYALID